MLEKVVMKKKHDWDIYLPMLLFVYREIQHETTGYSPFELLFGRVVKSPISNLKEKWINSKPVKQYPFAVFSTHTLNKQTCYTKLFFSKVTNVIVI